MENIIVGAVKINKPFVETNRSYECAAWWEERTAELGIFPILLGRSENHFKNLILTAKIEAKVTDDYFPALFGGVAISKEPYQAKNIGQTRTLHKRVDIIQAIEATGNSPGSDLDWFIHPDWWHLFQQEAEKELQKTYASLPKYWEEWNTLDRKTYQSKYQGRWDFDEEYRSKVGMIAHFGSELEHWARRLEKLNWKMTYHTPGHAHCSEYNQKLYHQNTAWAEAIRFSKLSVSSAEIAALMIRIESEWR